MLGVPPIHRGAKINEGFFIYFIFYFFLFPILLQYYKLKMLHKERLSYKNNYFIALLREDIREVKKNRTKTDVM